LIAFVPAVVIGLMFSSTSIYTGPLVSKVDGLDFSYTSAFVIAAVIYGALCLAFPERAAGGVDLGALAATNPSLAIGEEASI
jgi:purine-cytosine permease-like protein